MNSKNHGNNILILFVYVMTKNLHINYPLNTDSRSLSNSTSYVMSRFLSSVNNFYGMIRFRLSWSRAPWFKFHRNKTTDLLRQARYKKTELYLRAEHAARLKACVTGCKTKPSNAHRGEGTCHATFASTRPPHP